MPANAMKFGDGRGRKDLVLGLDCGTTGIKAIVFDKKGRMAAAAHASTPLFSPKPGYYEQNAQDWWTSVQKALRILAIKINPERIAALAISNQRETFVPQNKAGHPVRPAIVWLDERSKSEVECFSRKIGKEQIHRITGKPVDYAPVVYRLAWMKKYELPLFKKTHKICDVHTYLVWRLTGHFRTSWASADPLGLFDMRRRKWSPQIRRALELEEDQLPEVYCPGSTLGKVTKRASELTGLSPETLIVAGGGDGQAAGLGVNALASEQAYLNLGTAVVTGIYGSKYKISKAFRTMSSCSESGYYFECSLRAGTFAVDWFIKSILRIDPLRQPDIYEQLEREARQVVAGSDGLLHLPYLCGSMNPYWDMNARGAFIGISASHHRGHMYRSILEGIAFEQLFAIQSVEKAIGRKVHSLVAIGGGAASDLWCHIFADVTGINICLPKNTEASALGAAIAAAVGAGWYPSFQEAAHAMTGIRKKIKPDLENYRKYQEFFPTYRKLYPCLKNATDHAARPGATTKSMLVREQPRR
jgi:sugar (pentulose or hexulose) kinase